jgi:hypothetical protein
VRKGVAFGLFFGWIYLIAYIIYSIGFIASFLLSDHEGYENLNLSNILIVSYLFASYTEKIDMFSIIGQIVIIFALNTTFFAYVSPFLQSLAEAQGAIAPVFRLIDQVHPSISTATWSICSDYVGRGNKFE